MSIRRTTAIAALASTLGLAPPAGAELASYNDGHTGVIVVSQGLLATGGSAACAFEQVTYPSSAVTDIFVTATGVASPEPVRRPLNTGARCVLRDPATGTVLVDDMFVAPGAAVVGGWGTQYRAVPLEICASVYVVREGLGAYTSPLECVLPG